VLISSQRPLVSCLARVGMAGSRRSREELGAWHWPRLRGDPVDAWPVSASVRSTVARHSPRRSVIGTAAEPGARKSRRRTGSSVRNYRAGFCGGLLRFRSAPTLPPPAVHGESSLAGDRSPGLARMRPAPATDGYGRFAGPSVSSGRLPGTRRRRGPQTVLLRGGSSGLARRRGP
jgi:hypothetical protein